MDSSCGAIIIWKEYSFRLVMRRSVETNSSSLKADAWHHRAMQLLLFLLEFLCSIVRKGYESADDWAVFASGFILFNAYLIFRPLGEIMDEHVHDDLIEKIRATSNQVEGIIDTEKCFIRKAAE
jgi:divalent metal cation (Fe/Co/Zn/Cd) transporter